MSTPTVTSRATVTDDEPSSVRAQSAVVRSLADALEHLAARGGSTDGLREQFAEELSRLRKQEAAEAAAGRR